MTVQLTSCLDGLDSTKQINLLFFNISKATQFQTGKTGGQPYRDTSSVSKLSMVSQKLVEKVPPIRPPIALDWLTYSACSLNLLTHFPPTTKQKESNFKSAKTIEAILW